MRQDQWLQAPASITSLPWWAGPSNSELESTFPSTAMKEGAVEKRICLEGARLPSKAKKDKRNWGDAEEGGEQTYKGQKVRA